jgi:crotonobetainyl-CoA:carnitine CoA-transferase CaiB-like acyl-CoA transferase
VSEATGSGFEPLRGLRVLEIGDGVAGAAAGSVLASYGADLTTVGDPSSTLRRTPPFVVDDGGAQTSLLSMLLDIDKTVVEDFSHAAFESFDLVICDRVSGPAPRTPVDADSHVAMVEQVNPGVWVTISAFGLVGPRREETGSELVAAAAGGLLSVVSDADTERPVPLAGSQALLSTGHAAALAACHGLSRRRHDGGSVHVDVSAQAATLATGPVMKVVALLLASSPTGGAVRYAAPAAFYRCRDGLLRISALEDHQWRGLTEAFGRPDWNERFPDPTDRIEHANEIDALISDVIRTRAKAGCEATLQAAGVPAAAMYGPREILESAQFAARAALVSRSIGGRELRYVARPFRVEASDEIGPIDPSAGLEGLRIAEAGHVLAVPLAGALLGAMGADVVKIEDTDRVDIFRRKRPYVDDVPGEERAVYFSLVNHSKRSVACSFERSPDVLHGILDRSEVLLENLGPGRAGKLGLDANSARVAHPGLLAVSSSAYGHQGPWSQYRAYAYNLHTACGLLHLTRSGSGQPASVEMAWADVIAGYAIATLVAAWAVGGRQGASVDFSMAELVASRFNEYLGAESLDVPYSSTGAVDDALVEAGDSLVALSPSASDQQVGVARLLADPALRESATTLVDELHRIGVPATVVADTESLLADEQLSSFGIFAEVDHPEWGRRRIVGVPWRFVGNPTIALGAPPRFGATAQIPDGAAGDFDPWSINLVGGR